MSNTNNPLTKTCSHCGEQKPLSAFLQLTEQSGSTYGSICSSCRKTYTEKETPKDPDEVTTSTTGAKIDAKTKVEKEAAERELRKKLKEQKQEEKEKKEEQVEQKIEKTHHIYKDEKKHRKDYIEKRSFLDSTKKPTASSHMVFGGEEQKAQAGKLDFATGPVEHTRVATIKLTQSPIFQSFKNWLGNAPIVSAAERQQNKPAKEKPGTDPINDYANRTGPKSRK